VKNKRDFEELLERHEALADEVDYLGSEVKLQALNLAIAVAKLQNKEITFRELEDRFTDLISRVNRTAGQIDDVLDAFRARKTLLFSLPASSDVLEKRGAYDKIEASLNYAHELGNEILQTITQIKTRKQAG
jgi:hypothetical protein